MVISRVVKYSKRLLHYAICELIRFSTVTEDIKGAALG